MIFFPKKLEASDDLLMKKFLVDCASLIIVVVVVVVVSGNTQRRPDQQVEFRNCFGSVLEKKDPANDGHHRVLSGLVLVLICHENHYCFDDL